MISPKTEKSFFTRCRQTNWLALMLVVFLFSENAGAQDPACFRITTQEGLPSNEIYSMLIDQNGFLWIGSDAGISKYAGVGFNSYTSPHQHTRALTNLCESPSGRIYAHSFSGQIFYVEADSLYLLEGWNRKLSNLSCDDQGNLWAASAEGVYQYNETQKQWLGPLYPAGLSDTRAMGVTPSDKGVNAIFKSALGFFDQQTWHMYPLNDPVIDELGNYLLSESDGLPIVCSVSGGIVFTAQQGIYTNTASQKLVAALTGKKLTNVRTFADGTTWFCTYDGVVVYEFSKDHVQQFFKGVIVSDVLFDNEGNCWLSSLHNGLFRIPSLDGQVWNREEGSATVFSPLKTDQSETTLFFSTISGEIGTFEFETEALNLYTTNSRSDIQSLNYDSKDEAVYFYTEGYVHALRNEVVKKFPVQFPPVKDLFHHHMGYVLATSQGTFFYRHLDDTANGQKLCNDWSRELAFSPQTGVLAIATNDGILFFEYIDEGWVQKNHLLSPAQIISIAYNGTHNCFYALSFDGAVYRIYASFDIEFIGRLERNVVPNQIIVGPGKVMVATNAGLFTLDEITGAWEKQTQHAGLASDDIRSAIFHDQRIWLATSNGLQSIPQAMPVHKKNGKIYLKKLLVDAEKVDPKTPLTLNYDQSLSFILEAAHYSSGENFRYAYRLPMTDSVWNFVPATAREITIPSLPTGDFRLEIKFVDQVGNDSENYILLNGTVVPPFWQRWWFYVLIGFVGILLTFLLFRYRISILKQKQVSELRKIQLENELILSQQIALKAQMNPHFIFNVLNSIKGYIYDNDKKKAAVYLSDFSDLVRKILTMSSQSQLTLREELETLEVYIRLEQMLLEGDFRYELELSENLDPDSIRIPVLLIQPFVENAFQHGLRHRQGAKRLHLKIYPEQEDTLLVIEISDNGIGREASAVINAQRSSHKSFAVESSTRRIELINRERSGQVGLEVRDLHDSKNVSLGTCVILKIHFHD